MTDVIDALNDRLGDGQLEPKKKWIDKMCIRDRCRACMWFTDGRKCPAVRERKNRENTIDYNTDGKIDDFDRAIEYELYGAGKDRLEDSES